MRTRTTLKPWLVVSPLLTLSSAAGAEPTAVVRLWTGDPPGPKHVVQGPEQDMTKPTDKLIAGRPIIKLGNVATPEMHVFLPQSLPGGGDVRGGRQWAGRARLAGTPGRPGLRLVQPRTGGARCTTQRQPAGPF